MRACRSPRVFFKRSEEGEGLYEEGHLFGAERDAERRLGWWTTTNARAGRGCEGDVGFEAGAEVVVTAAAVVAVAVGGGRHA